MKYKKIFFIFNIFFFYIFINSSIAKDNSCEIFLLKNNFLDPKNIESIDIEVYDARKWYINFAKILSDRRNQIRNKFKKKFPAKVTVNYKNDIKCDLEAKIRQVGDFKDHIKFEGNNKYQSLNVDLKNGNILGTTKFKLFIPQTRNGINEVFTTAILREAKILSPRSYLFPVKFNESEKKLMIFQENPVKEFIEFNNRREGPIFEADEQILWNYRAKNLKDPELLVLNRQTNKNYFLKSNSTKINSSYWFLKLQNEFIKYHLSERKIFDLMSLSNGNKKLFEQFVVFEILQNAMGGDHGLIYHNRKFFANNFENSFEPIYYDGMSHVFTDIFETTNTFKTKKYNFETLFIYMSQLENLDKFEKKLINLLNNKNSKKIYEEVSFNTNLDYKDFLKSIEAIKVNINFLFEEYKNFAKIQDLELDIHNNSEKYKKIIMNNYSDIYFYELDLNTKDNSKFLDFKKCTNDNCSVLNNTKLITDIIFGKMSADEKHLITSKKFEIDEIYFKEININSQKIKIGFSKFIKIDIDENLKNIKIIKEKDNDFLTFFDSNLKDINIIFEDQSLKLESDVQKDRSNEYNITGCLNIYNSVFNNTNLNVINSDCEDALNIINSKGEINSINIYDSKSDAFDSDFSDLKINNLFINYSMNDCADFSLGRYQINKAILTNCGDKGFSVGENSDFLADELIVSKSGIGLASKDSSKTYVKKANINNVKNCLSVYNKKQEFNGSILEVKNLTCENYNEKFQVDNKSILKVNNDVIN